MPLEAPAVLKKKNQKRLRGVTNAFLAMGVDFRSPPTFADPLKLITFALVAIGYFDIYGHVEYVKRHKDSIFNVAESVCTCLQIVVSQFKLSYIMFTQRRFYNMMKTVRSNELIDKIGFLADETPYNKELRKDIFETLERCWAIAAKQFDFYLFLCISVVSYYFFGALAVNTYNSIIGNTKHTNILAFPTLFPFWEDKMNSFPQYPILAVAVGLGDFLSGACSVGFDGLFIIIALHGVALFRILKKMVAFTTSPIVPKELRVKYLQQCIGHCERTYQFCEEFNNLYLHLSFIQFLLSLIVLGAVMFQGALGLEKDFNVFFQMVTHLSAAVYEVLIFCLNGQLITTESESMSFVWYDCEWYNEPREFQRLITMMIMRSNRTVSMKASWFTTMSLATFLEILKTSASYFLLLRNFDA